MSDLLANPAVQSGALPFVTALLLAAVLGFSARGLARAAGLAVPAGFLTAYTVTFGLPPLLPASSGQKIFHLAAAAGLAGLIFDLLDTRLRARFLVGLTLAAAAIAWIGWRKLAAAPSADHLSMAALLLGAALMLHGSERGHDDAADPTVSLLIVAFAMAGIAFLGASASISQNAGAVAAALGGLLVLNWPRRRFGLGVASRLVPLVVFVGLATQVALFTRATAWVLVFLPLALYVDLFVDRFLPAASARAGILRPVLIAAAALIPAAAALGAAFATTPSTDPYGGY